jgi:hypothetical protein
VAGQTTLVCRPYHLSPYILAEFQLFQKCKEPAVLMNDGPKNLGFQGDSFCWVRMGGYMSQVRTVVGWIYIYIYIYIWLCIWIVTGYG